MSHSDVELEEERELDVLKNGKKAVDTEESENFFSYNIHDIDN